MKNLHLNQILQNEKNKFLDEKHLDWYVATYIQTILNFLKWTIRKLWISLNNTLKIMKY